MGSASSSSDSEFGGRRRAAKMRERFPTDAAEEARGILQHWTIEDKKSQEARYEQARSKLGPTASAAKLANVYEEA